MTVRPNVVAIIQARMGSQRLPGKALADIAGQSMLRRVVGRLQRCRQLNRIVVATSTLPQDRLILDECISHGWDAFAGSHQDVLGRYVGAANRFNADLIVRVTADCPLIEPTIVDRVVSAMRDNPKYDYVCNFHPRRTFPRGLDVECVRSEALHRIHLIAVEPEYREHVTLYIYRNPSQFDIGSVLCDQNWSSLRWTVDEPEDLQLVRAIYHYFGGDQFTWLDLLRAYQSNKDWLAVNQNVEQKVA